MDCRYEQGQREAQRLAPGLQPPDLHTPPWTPTMAYAGHPHGPPPQSAGVPPFAGPPFPFFGCPPSGPFSGVVPGPPVDTHCDARFLHFPAFVEQCRADAQGPPSYYLEPESHRQQQGQELLQHGGVPPGGLQWPGQGSIPGAVPLEDELTLQRRLDTQWLGQFIQRTKNRSRSPPPQQQSSAGLGHILLGAAQLVCRVEELYHTLKENLKNHGGWEDSYRTALSVRRELQERGLRLEGLKAETSRAARRRRSRLLRAQEERRQAEERSCEKEAVINRWRMKRIQQVEEKKKEKELKLAADSVLSEVRKKQADVNRMQDVLRSLEKLRRLRKDAASRRGIVTEQQCDVEFGSRLEQLRCVMKKRTVVYSAEEKALMVMLEGEQEKERKREQERRGKKERERQLQRKRTVDSILFGDEHPADCVMQPFTHYYTQAQQSLHSLIQVRREWDIFMVAADHPDGSTVPRSWILPDPPGGKAWASAQSPADTDFNSFVLSARA